MSDKAREAAALVYSRRLYHGAGGRARGIEVDDIMAPLIPGVLDDTNAAIDAYIAALWQPIESAPRDGTSLLMWEDGPWVASAFNRDGKFIGWDADSHFLSNPTHWQPIIPPAEPRTEQT